MIPIHAQSNRVSTAGYDWFGNMIYTASSPSTTYYRWDPLGRVAWIDAPGPVTYDDLLYGYDAVGERVVTYGLGQPGAPYAEATYTVRDLEGRPIREYQYTHTGELVWSRDHVFLGRNAIASEASTAWPTGGELLHHHRDHLGSLRLLTDPDGLVVAEQAFEPFGSAWAQTEEPLQFTGHEREPGYGWDYMHARYYTPEWGRFWSVDPIGGNPGMPQSWNAYAYVMGDPVNLLDPYGLECTQSSDGQIRCDGGEITVTAEYEVTTIPIPYWGPIKIPGRGGGGEGGGGQQSWDFSAQVPDPNMIDLPASDPRPCTLSFPERWWVHFSTTNEAIPGAMAPLGSTFPFWALGFETRAAAAGFPSMFGWLLRFAPAVNSGGVQFTRLESAILAGQGSLIDAVALGLALEVGIGIGSAVNAVMMPCSETNLVGF